MTRRQGIIASEFSCAQERLSRDYHCRHLGNPRKVAHIAEINRRLGLLTATILTPQMLVEEDSSERQRD